MSQIIVGCHLTDQPDADRIDALGREIRQRYQPLFVEPLQVCTLQSGNQGLLHIDIARGPEPPHARESDRLICLSGRPVVAATHRERDAARLGPRELLDFLRPSPAGIDRAALHQVNPPFTLCWLDTTERVLGLAHDGLGSDSFFVAHTSRGVVFSNKCWPILTLLGVAPAVDVDAWKYWFALESFPDDTSPFANIRQVKRGEVIHGDSRSVQCTTEDTFRSWLAARGEKPPALMRRALAGVRRIVHASYEPDVGYAAGLTGGIDSRALCSIVVKDQLRCGFYTGGQRFSNDVLIARALATRLHLAWAQTEEPRVSRSHAAEGLDGQMRKLLVWGEGLADPSRLARFNLEPAETVRRAFLDGGASEVSKGHYYRASLWKNPQHRPDHALVLQSHRDNVKLLGDADTKSVLDQVRDQVHEGEAYGLEGLHLLDYFYLRQRARRWQAAHRAINLFDASVLPFISIEHMTLAFAMSPAEKASREFQRFIIAENAPDLLRLRVNWDLRAILYSRYMALRSRFPSLPGSRRRDGLVEHLRAEGRPALDHALDADGPLWLIVDRNKAMARYRAFQARRHDDAQFILKLLSFREWHRMYVERRS
jgi:hypothetical protein